MMRVTGPSRFVSAAPVVVAAIVAMVVAGQTSIAAGVVLISPSEAITRAVERRLGDGVSVVVEEVRTRVAAAPDLEAQPEPNARTGEVSRFVLSRSGRRVGEVVATVRVRALSPRAARAIERGEVLAAEAIDVTGGELTGALFKRLPSSEELVGLNARRHIIAGEPLTADVVEVPPQVRSGDRVAVAVNIGVVRASGTAIASGSGSAGDIIHILQRGRVRPLKVRVTGPGTVEVMP